MGDAVLDMLNAQRAGGIAMPPGSAGPLSMDAPPQGMMPHHSVMPMATLMPGQQLPPGAMPMASMPGQVPFYPQCGVACQPQHPPQMQQMFMPMPGQPGVVMEGAQDAARFPPQAPGPPTSQMIGGTMGRRHLQEQLGERQLPVAAAAVLRCSPLPVS